MLRQRIFELGIIILLAILSIYIQGYDFGISNHASQIVVVHKTIDKSLYPTDPFVNALQFYTTFFWKFIAHFSKIVDLEVLLFIIHVSTRIAAIAAVWYLCKKLTCGSFYTAAIASSLFALSPVTTLVTPIGASDINDAYLTHATIVKSDE